MAEEPDAAVMEEKVNGMPATATATTAEEEEEQGEVYTNGANDSGIEDDKASGLRTGLSTPNSHYVNYGRRKSSIPIISAYAHMMLNQVKAIPKASPASKPGVTSPRSRIVKGVNRHRKGNLSKTPSPGVSPQHKPKKTVHSPKKSPIACRNTEDKVLHSPSVGDSEGTPEYDSSEISAPSPDVGSFDEATEPVGYDSLIESMTEDIIETELGGDDKTIELVTEDGSPEIESGTDSAPVQKPQSPRKGVVKGVNRIPKKISNTPRPKSEVITRPKTESKTRPKSELVLDNEDVNGNVHSTPPKAPGSPSPRGKDIKSKVGSMDKIKHKPGGGDVKIMTQKVDVGAVGSKCGSTANIKHTPGGGDKKIESHKLEWGAKSKVGSFNNAKHTPGGGDKKIESRKLEWKVESKVGSMDNARHRAGGGDKKVESQKLQWNAQSKVGSLNNATHKPGGGDKKVLSKQLSLQPKSGADSTEDLHSPPPGGNRKMLLRQQSEPCRGSKIPSFTPPSGSKQIESQKVEWNTQSKVGSMKYIHHTPKGGDKKIETQKVEWNAQSKVGSMKYLHHSPQGGDVKIESHKLDFREKATSKVGSKKNINHRPGGGERMIESHKLDFKDRAQARTNHGFNSPGRSPRQISESSSVDGVDVAED